ncbi:uncharacterized protein BX663DRAFT_258320 [Cokeromyces recurvatus]|uniref:uncharacterized protein n=1 Tax=Cokeromyces recurvatus TaxID=90255 RepID=UPI00222088A0|nr:uncharacterized protein BX663DRAFT_258320 [Cokeromyces recurvatus]KAI7898459.1 hypothetical protein BX663DRAFT_258320 [Cokeromyces recurvatus]
MNSSDSHTGITSINANRSLNNISFSHTENMIPASNNSTIHDLSNQHPSFQNLSEADKRIYEKNNTRLIQLELELRELSTFGGACDELLEWLKDSRAYNVFNEAALLNCIATIAEKAVEYGPWSGKEVLKQANSMCQGLSERGQSK